MSLFRSFPLLVFCIFLLAGCSGKKYKKDDGERIFATSSELQVDPNLLGVEIESPAVIENTCWLTTDFDYSNAGLSMESYPYINAGDYRKHFARKGDYDFYLHPIMCDGMVYDVKKGGDVVAYSLSNGAVKRLWSVDVLKHKERKNLLFLQARLEDKVLYIAGNNGIVLAFNVENKEILWKRQFDSNFGGSPSLSDDKLFLISATDEVYAIDKNNGELLWKHKSEEKASITSLQIPPVAIYHDRIVAGFSNGFVAVLDKNGDVLWQNKLANSQNTKNIVDINDIDFPPMLFGNVLVVGGIKTSVMGFDFSSGQPIWQIQSGLNSFMLHNSQGFGFFVNGENEKICYHIPTGNIKWIKKDAPFAEEVEMPGYLNGGDSRSVVNINRYYDAY